MTANEFRDKYEPGVHGLGELLHTYLGNNDLSEFSFKVPQTNGTCEVLGAHSRGIPSILHMDINGQSTIFSCHIELSEKAKFIRVDFNHSVIELNPEEKIKSFMTEIFENSQYNKRVAC